MSRLAPIAAALIVSWAAALVALPAAAQDTGGAWLAERPELGEPRPFALPQTETVTLDNGLAVTLIPTGVAPKAAIRVQVRAGNLNDGDDVWLADLAAELMTEGAAGKDGTEIAEEAAAMGGSLNTGVGRLTSTFSISVLSEYADDAVRLLADVVAAPDFPADELDRIKDNFLRDLEVSLAEPGPVASAAFNAALFGEDHPYGRTFPDPDRLAAYTLDQVRGFYDGNYGAARTRIYVAGQYDRDAVLAALRDSFGGWRAGPPPLSLPSEPRDERRVILIDRPGAPQSTIRLGLPTFGPANARDIELQVANTMLGGSFTSRITQNIREDKGYTYSPGSDVAYTADGGYWLFDADIATEVTGAALTEVFGEIERMRTQTPPEDEAERTRNYQAGTFVLGVASPAGMIGQVAFRDLYGLPDDYLDTFVPRTMAVGADRIGAAARDLIDPARMVLVVVGDLDAIRPQLDAVAALDGVTFEIQGAD